MDASLENSAVIGGSQTSYRVDGPENAEHIFLLIHGIGSFHTCFDGITESLIAANRKVIRYDLLGRGGSDYWSNNRFGADEHVAQLLGLLEHLSVTKPLHLIGHSMGGALAALFAAAHPARVASLALLCPAGLMDGAVLGCVRSLCCLHGLIKNSLRNNQEAAWRSDFFCHEGDSLEKEERMVKELKTEYARNGDRMFEAFWRSVLEFPLYGLRKKLKPLTRIESLAILIVWGDHDSTIPMRPNLQRWLHLLEGSDCNKVEHEVMENAAHGFIIEHAQMTAEIILRFHSKHFPEQL